ncbi:MAG: Hsp20/alpha crystallin family protein [Bacteroidetes bacterium]|nr:Hsp20/alpha crystallin family protein [Bacteroidota bacterium]MBS1974125.1 Hsp20/alpha crystallin family protein [Bacteroidota bacterium]
MQVLKVNNNPQKSISNVFDEFFNEFPAFGNKEWSNWNFPPVNIHETKDAYHIELSVPGRAKEDFKVHVENGFLAISSEKKEETKQEDYKTVRREFSFRSFRRNFNLDESVDSNNIQAKYENGLLKLFIPKKEQEKASSRQISIE